MSLAVPNVYSIPMLLLVGWRGEPGKRDEPQHMIQGQATPGILGILTSLYPCTCNPTKLLYSVQVWSHYTRLFLKFEFGALIFRAAYYQNFKTFLMLWLSSLSRLAALRGHYCQVYLNCRASDILRGCGPAKFPKKREIPRKSRKIGWFFREFAPENPAKFCFFFRVISEALKLLGYKKLMSTSQAKNWKLMLVAVYNPQHFSYVLVTWFNWCTDSKNTEQYSKLFTENKLQFSHIFLHYTWVFYHLSQG